MSRPPLHLDTGTLHLLLWYLYNPEKPLEIITANLMAAELEALSRAYEQQS